MEQERGLGQAKMERETSQGSPKWPQDDTYQIFRDFLIISGRILEPFWDQIPKNIRWKFNVGIDAQTTSKTFAKISKQMMMQIMSIYEKYTDFNLRELYEQFT